MTSKTLVFMLPKKNVQNINTYKSLHWAVKGKITEFLRQAAITEGLKHHEEKDLPQLEERLDALKAIADQAIRKSRRTKALLKPGDLTPKEVKALVDEEFAEEVLVDPKSLDVPTLFDRYRIRVAVAPPTRRRLDPVNLYPTVKALIDGLTDVSWWEDDDFSHLLELSFVYGGLSGEKDSFKVTVTVTSIDDEEELSSYVLNT